MSTPMVKLLPGGSGVEMGQWRITSKKSHIMKSEDLESFSKEIDLPMPEMVFGENKLLIENKTSGFSLSFSARPALALVDNKKDILKVSYAEAWAKSRVEGTMDRVKDVFKPFDWTFTTKYSGEMVFVNGQQPQETTEEINVNMLKRPDPILFYDDLVLFEDELADNGSSKLNVRVRVMPGCYFVLLRFFLRVDDVLARIIDSRFFHEFGKDYLIHEQSVREATFEQILKDSGKTTLEKSQTGNENWLYSILPVTETKLRKVMIA